MPILAAENESDNECTLVSRNGKFILFTTLILVCEACVFTLTGDLWSYYDSFLYPSDTDTRSIIQDDKEATKQARTTSASLQPHPWFPIHPSIHVISQTIESLKFLEGLSPTTPLFLPTDGPQPKHSPDDRQRLFDYVETLRQTHNQSHQHILFQADKHLHLGGNIQQAHERVKTKYIYVIQHDFPFVRPVNHTAVLKSMQEYPDILKLVRFQPRQYLSRDVCRSNASLEDDKLVSYVNGVHFSKTTTWSDMQVANASGTHESFSFMTQGDFCKCPTNLLFIRLTCTWCVLSNHLTTWSYYKKVFEFMVHTKRYPDYVMLNRALRNCSYWGPHMYGEPLDPPVLRHLDGRNTQAA